MSRTRMAGGERIGRTMPRRSLRHEEQQSGVSVSVPLSVTSAGNPPFRVYREILGASLGLRAEIDRHCLIPCAGLFERDVRPERTGARSVLEPEISVVLSSVNRSLNSERGPGPAEREIGVTRRFAAKMDPVERSGH